MGSLVDRQIEVVRQKGMAMLADIKKTSVQLLADPDLPADVHQRLREKLEELPRQHRLLRQGRFAPVRRWSDNWVAELRDRLQAHIARICAVPQGNPRKN